MPNITRLETEPRHATGHLDLGDSCLATYWSEGQVTLLASAILAFRAALRQARDGSEEKIRAQIGLADALRLEVDEGVGGDENRDDAMSLAEEAVTAAASFPALYPDALRALGEVLFDRSRDQVSERLQRTVDTFRRLVELTSDSPPHTAVKSLALYAQALNVQWFRLRDPKLMESANSAVDQAMTIQNRVTLVPDLDLCFAVMRARWAKCAVTGDVDDLTQAIDMSEQLIPGCPPGYPLLAKLWIQLGVLYGGKAEILGGNEYQERKLHAFSEATKRVRPDHSLWHVCNGNYASALFLRYLSQSDLDDLNESIAITRKVVYRLAERGFQEQGSFMYVGNLIGHLCASYSHSGNVELLDEAVALHPDSLDGIPPPVRYLVLLNLGGIYRARYKAHGRMSDLESAISLQEQSFVDSGGSNFNFIRGSRNLAEALLDRFDECGQPEDMERVISVLTAAIEHPRQEYKDSAYSLLGHVLLKKGTLVGDIDLIGESIFCQQKALDLFSETHFERPVSYRRLGLAEYRAYEIEQRAPALQNSIAAFNQALSLLPQDHPDRTAYLLDLATSQLTASDIRNSDELSAVLKTLEEAALHAQSWPADRYAAAALWARTEHRARRLEIALEAYQLAISLLPQVAWLGLEDELRVQRLSRQPPDISQDAACCAIDLGHYELAVEIIDGSRSVLWNTSQELRVELGKLREVAPDVAQELAQTNMALAFRPGPALDDQDERRVESERRRIHRLATRRTELLHLVRTISGFEHFLVPPSYDVLRNASRQGPVVILISSVYGCHALVVQAEGEISLVPLRNVTHRMILAQGEALQRSSRLIKDQKGRDFLQLVLLRILRDLWNQIGQPVCIVLGLQPSDLHLRRVWWCPTGAMTVLPIHACGPYNREEPNMTELAVSSYTPTLSTLLRSQTRPRANSSSSLLSPRVLVIAQPELLTRPPLPCALEEARALYSLIPSLCTFRVGPQGTVAVVKDMLRDHNWLHVSSHGTQDRTNPLQSSIELYDGDLKLSDLAKERIPNAEFAFLSACHSARATEALPDEAMHLAAGMMFAGFRSVVATSWSIADKDAPVVADVFYRHLTRDGKLPDVKETAEALHMAAKHLREEGVPFYRWVPFIHLGA